MDDGTQIKLRVYVFKNKDKAKQYRNRASGVVFGVNGQMHGTYSTDFFTRRKVNLSYIADSCSCTRTAAKSMGRPVKTSS